MPPDKVCEEEDFVLKDMERLIGEFHDNTKFRWGLIISWALIWRSNMAQQASV